MERVRRGAVNFRLLRLLLESLVKGSLYDDLPGVLRPLQTVVGVEPVPTSLRGCAPNRPRFRWF